MNHKSYLIDYLLSQWLLFKIVLGLEVLKGIDEYV